jgi:hypothetical protein
MAFAVKYRAECQDETKINWKVDISLDGYVGSVNEMKLVGGRPLTLQVDGENSDKFGITSDEGVIKGITLRMKVTATEYQYIEFIETTDDQTYKVEVYKDSVLFTTIQALYTQASKRQWRFFLIYWEL